MTQKSTFEEMPTQVNLMDPTLRALQALGGSASIQEITPQVIKDLGLGAPITEQPHGDDHRTELEYRLAWARTRLRRSGLIQNSSRGVWSLTAEGIKTLRSEFREKVTSSDNLLGERPDERATDFLTDIDSEDNSLDAGVEVEEDEWRQELRRHC